MLLEPNIGFHRAVLRVIIPLKSTKNGHYSTLANIFLTSIENLLSNQVALDLAYSLYFIPLENVYWILSNKCHKIFILLYFFTKTLLCMI
jgi:hypothetical protein